MNATDALSGVASITYQSTGGQVTPPTTVSGSTASLTITANGVTTVSFHATDLAGNVEIDNSVSVNITRSHVVLDRISLAFGDQRVGTTSSPQTVTLTNTGNLDLNVTSIAPDNLDYAETDNCGAVVPAGGMCQINVTFSPTATGPDNGTLIITDDADNNPQNVTLTGTGTASAVTLSQTFVDFGTVPAGTASAPQTVTLTNSGTAPLTISSIATTNPDFSESDNCPISPGTLPPTQQCTLTLTATPASDLGETGNVIINDDAADTPQSITMTVNGGVAPPRPPRTQSAPTPRPTPRPTQPRR
jgi:hypothetical protein